VINIVSDLLTGVSNELLEPYYIYISERIFALQKLFEDVDSADVLTLAKVITHTNSRRSPAYTHRFGNAIVNSGFRSHQHVHMARSIWFGGRQGYSLHYTNTTLHNGASI
jgi:hypothetical protein